MPPKYILLAFLIFFSHFTQAQNKWLARRVERIDSLMLHYWHNYDQAQNEANELYDLLTTKYTTKEYKDAKIQVMLQRGFLVSLKGDFSTALQMGLEALEEAEKNKLPEKIYNSCLFIAIVC